MKNYFKHKLRSKNPAVIVGTVIFIAILAVLFITLFGYVLMYLWNWLMPLIFGLPIITFWQALGLCLLSKILFGGFGNDKGSKKDHKCDSKSSKRKSSSSDFSKWKHYDSFWQEEGEKAYANYIHKKNGPDLSEDQGALESQND
ncbi:hypothetical protein RQM59_10950 [Flavobacteriaceae bacterium S356]|uniref:Uncharacterized protein n=1 Tax=Asprobacillus argus TaxID=3076534 RepID=A0ABU3LGQ4_9FLAO|nr:hypothetical protein [Flavobacteriaceae bacterium S356]